MDSVATRIFELADAKFPEQKDFAFALGEKPSTVSKWRVGITTSYTRRISKIAEVLETTTEYLLTGKQSSPSKMDRLLEVFGDLTEDEQQDVARYVDLVKARRKR